MSIECVSVSEANRLIYQMEPRRLAKELCEMTKELRELRTENEKLKETIREINGLVDEVDVKDGE